MSEGIAVRSRPSIEIRGTTVVPGDYVVGTTETKRGSEQFSGRLRSVAVWSGGTFLYVDDQIVKIPHGLEALVALSMHIPKRPTQNGVTIL